MTATHESPRESMATVGRWLPRPLYGLVQRLLTWLTGKPLPGQAPLWKRSPLSQTVTTLAAWVVGVGGSILICGLPPAYWPLLLASWALTVFGARKLQAVICHHAAHNGLSGDGRVDRWMMDGLSLFSLSQPYVGYRAAHEMHHSARLATLDDPDFQFLIGLGFRPGMSRGRLWRGLLSAMISPRFHWLYLKARLRANFLDAPLPRRLLAWAVAGSALAAVAAFGAWVPFVVAWLVPLTVLYHASGLLQFLTEHRWSRVGKAHEPKGIRLLLRTNARFCGEAAPNGQGAFAWMKWWARMIFVHLPTRLLVVQGDLPQHDYHHRHATGDWANALYARAEDARRHPAGYTEAWGLHEAIDGVFRVMSELPPVRKSSVFRPAPELLHAM